MTRVIRNLPKDSAVDWTKAQPYREYDPPNGWVESYKEAKDNAPYKPGDCLFIREGGRIRYVRVYLVFAEYLERRCDWIPKYRVQFATKAGTWSRQWLDTFPGYIFRAYHDADEKLCAPPRADYEPVESFAARMPAKESANA